MPLLQCHNIDHSGGHSEGHSRPYWLSSLAVLNPMKGTFVSRRSGLSLALDISNSKAK